MSDTMRLRIESDGTAQSTRVVDVQTGRVLPVQAVTWHMDIRDGNLGAATATIIVPLVQIDAEAVADHPAIDGTLYFATLPVPNARETA